MIETKEGIWHGDIMAIKSLLPYPYTFIYSQEYINIGGIMVRIKRICKVCGKLFKAYPSVIKNGGGKFCSRECFGIWFSRNKSEKKHPSWKGGKIECICEECCKRFKAFPAIIKKGGAKFCSTKCHYNSCRTGVTKVKRICEECGKEFEVPPSVIKRGYGKYCSHSCSSKVTRAHLKIPNHHTKPELIFENICKRNNIDFQYTGDGTLWIGKTGKKQLNPDFIEANGKKICVEVFGDYWHSPLLNRSMKEGSMLNYRKSHYQRYKWYPIFIWESDLLRSDAEAFVLNTLKKEGVKW